MNRKEMKAAGLPTQEGFYWAKQQRMTPGTRDEAEFTPMGWEVVELVENCIDEDDDEYMKVQVPGVERWQCPEDFEWGPGPLEEPK